MQDFLEPLAGGIVLAITLLDVFLTVLYARASTGLLAPRLARGVWRIFRGLSSISTLAIPRSRSMAKGRPASTAASGSPIHTIRAL
jgi:hypothetical protein